MFSGLRSVWVNLKITFLQNFPTFSYLGVILHSTSKNSFLKHETFKPALVKELDRMAELVDYMTHLAMIIVIIVMIIIIIELVDHMAHVTIKGYDVKDYMAFNIFVGICHYYHRPR